MARSSGPSSSTTGAATPARQSEKRDQGEPHEQDDEPRAEIRRLQTLARATSDSAAVPERDVGAEEETKWPCATCNEEFTSKNKLHKHLRGQNHQLIDDHDDNNENKIRTEVNRQLQAKQIRRDVLHHYHVNAQQEPWMRSPLWVRCPVLMMASVLGLQNNMNIVRAAQQSRNSVG